MQRGKFDMNPSEKKYSILESGLLNSFESSLSRSSNEITKVTEARMLAFEAFRKTGLPGRLNEKWRNSKFDQVSEQSYEVVSSKPTYTQKVNEIFQCSIHGFTTQVEALLNGWYYTSEKKTLRTMDNGVVIGSIQTAQKEVPELFERHFGKIAKYNLHGYSHINTAFFNDGLFIYVPDQVHVEESIQLIKMVNDTQKLMINSRNLVILGKNSHLSLMHCDDSVNHQSSMINTVTEIFIGENASLDLYKLQNINNHTFLINSTSVVQQRNSRLKVNVITLNGGAIRNELNVDLQGEGAEADLNGIYLMDKKQQVDNQVFVNHAVPNCNSSELFKGVLDDESSAIFNGFVLVGRDAQKTNAFQRNNNILMTSTAKVDTMPFLEIYADDVKCSHGATIGQLDHDALFYLMQRGICKRDARLLLMYAFAAEVADKIDIQPLRVSIEDMVKKRLRGELSICEKCVLHCSTPDIPMEFEIDMSKI
ncbi:MAG: Fe-S cluster assembly protein SufD [Bacteroidetes bacterium CG18_big_fil_WC_8_21_14_2_50_41_14]|nr:MAG: Fe-S cluster assembly protein SufD [Bacteroidetes bacterium CG18_big_fil_WC_8_21_14_2_50_41_14]PJB54860.1 MAG: Fe-S cluster assembly protein SufD [Bacteroidetes bacterium CG_4_9_14_3_um_filter_41_19]